MEKVGYRGFTGCSILLAVLISACTGNPSARNEVPAGLVSLEDAVNQITTLVESRVPEGHEIAFTKVDAPLPALADFLYNELTVCFSTTGKLVVLARGKDAESLDGEHQYQMSGLVDDESAVGIGHYLGAKVIVTSSYNRFGNFSQFDIRALDVGTGVVVAALRPRIRNDDPVLAGVTGPLQNISAPVITEQALAYLNRGKEYYVRRKYDDAIKEFDQALAINRDLFEAYFCRGTVYGNKGDHDKAITDLSEAIRLNPSYADAYNNRGVNYHEKGMYDRAIEDFSDALRFNPNYADVAYSSCGAAYSGIGDYDRAIADLDEAIRLNPYNVQAYNNRGTAYAHIGDYDWAIANLNEAIRLNPNFAGAYGNRGTIYSRKGDYGRAIEDFSAAIRLNPGDVSPYFYRGAAYYCKNENNRARADWNKVLEIDPNNEYARSCLTKLSAGTKMTFSF
jgi:tetratricopeptide (TPR) repeat protein